MLVINTAGLTVAPLLISHFMAATQSMNNSAGLIAPTQCFPANHNRTNTRSYDDNDIGSASNGDCPQKVYSFVALPGRNTKKNYGTLNHLNAH
ncbi:11388_t:CDS:2, partial [Acaulospora morrowiae]